MKHAVKSLSFSLQQVSKTNNTMTYKLQTHLLALFLTLLSLVLLQQSCGVYSFTSASIDPNVKTLYVENFENLASTVEPSLTQTLVEKLKNKCISEARLDLSNQGGDVEFAGSIMNYVVEPAASGADDQAALSQLTINIRVDFVNNVTDENWSESFRQFETFPKDANLSDVETELIEQITNRLIDDIYNRAFANW